MQHEGKQVTGLKQTSGDFGLSFFQIVLPSFFGKTNKKKKGVQVKCKNCDVRLYICKSFEDYHTNLKLIYQQVMPVFIITTHLNKLVCNKQIFTLLGFLECATQ